MKILPMEWPASYIISNGNEIQFDYISEKIKIDEWYSTTTKYIGYDTRSFDLKKFNILFKNHKRTNIDKNRNIFKKVGDLFFNTAYDESFLDVILIVFPEGKKIFLCNSKAKYINLIKGFENAFKYDEKLKRVGDLSPAAYKLGHETPRHNGKADFANFIIRMLDEKYYGEFPEVFHINSDSRIATGQKLSLSYSKDVDLNKCACFIIEGEDFDELYSKLILFTPNYIEKAKEKAIKSQESDESEEGKLQKEEDYLENRNGGKIGEKEVDYALKWLDKSFIVVPKKPSEKYDDGAIVIYNPDYIDEAQECDHIVIGKQGVFLIETKNYAGELIIDSHKNWIRIKNDGIKEGERNPLQQLRRHEKLLSSILTDDIPIIGVICMAHPKMIITGVENSPIPLVKSDLLVDFIEKYPSNNKELSFQEMQECLKKIEQYMI